MKKRTSMIIIVAVILVIVGAASVSIAYWATTNSKSVSVTASTGNIETMGVELVDTGLGDGGKLYPYSQLNVKSPDANMLKIKLKLTLGSNNILCKYDIKNIANDPVDMYCYIGKNEKPSAVWNSSEWIQIVNTQSGNGTHIYRYSPAAKTDGEYVVLYFAFEPTSTLDMGKKYDLVLTAVPEVADEYEDYICKNCGRYIVGDPPTSGNSYDLNDLDRNVIVCSKNIDFYSATIGNTFTDFAVTFRAKDEIVKPKTRTGLELLFDNRKFVTFGIVTEDDGSTHIQSRGEHEGLELLHKDFNWQDWGYLTDAEIKRYRKTNGILMTVVRKGTDVYLYVDGRYVTRVNIAGYDIGNGTLIDKDTPVRLAINHWGARNYDIEIPLEITKQVDGSATVIANAIGDGNITLDKNECTMFESVKVKLEPNSGSYLKSLYVNGMAVTHPVDGNEICLTVVGDMNIVATYAPVSGLFAKSDQATYGADGVLSFNRNNGTIGVKVEDERFELTYKVISNKKEVGHSAGLGFDYTDANGNTVGCIFQTGYLIDYDDQNRYLHHCFVVRNTYNWQQALPASEKLKGTVTDGGTSYEYEYDGDDGENTLHETGIYIKVVRERDKYTLCYRLSDNDDWTVACEVSGLTAERFYFYTWSNEVTVSDISYNVI